MGRRNTPVGVLATWSGVCWSCDRTIVPLVSRVVQRKGNWVCVDCAMGGRE